MCRTCGCGVEPGTRRLGVQHSHEHHHDGVHDHAHDHVETPERRSVRLEVDLLAKNDALAAQNRAWLSDRGVLALNLIGAPGAGKTALLEQTIQRLKHRTPITVVEGDQETDRDAERIRATGCRVVQINTGAGCHLDADMMATGIREVSPPGGSLLLVENVGNLVCPALFDLGERAKVVVMSVTEGEDKPLKYPHVFRAAAIFVLTKVDLLPHLEFDVERALDNARKVNRGLRIFQVSATRGTGMDAWCDWLESEIAAAGGRVHGGGRDGAGERG